MLPRHSAGKPVEVALLVGELRESGQYNSEPGVSGATLVELFRLFPMVRPTAILRGTGRGNVQRRRRSLVSKL